MLTFDLEQPHGAISKLAVKENHRKPHTHRLKIHLKATQIFVLHCRRVRNIKASLKTYYVSNCSKAYPGNMPLLPQGLTFRSLRIAITAVCNSNEIRKVSVARVTNKEINRTTRLGCWGNFLRLVHNFQTLSAPYTASKDRTLSSSSTILRTTRLSNQSSLL